MVLAGVDIHPQPGKARGGLAVVLVGVGDKAPSELPQAEAAADLEGFYGYSRIQQQSKWNTLKGIPLCSMPSIKLITVSSS